MYTLTFSGATVSQNNLGGNGPDSGAEEMRFGDIGTTPDGESIDLVVTADSGYEVKNSDNNKIVNDEFGTINQLAGTVSTLQARDPTRALSPGRARSCSRCQLSGRTGGFGFCSMPASSSSSADCPTGR